MNVSRLIASMLVACVTLLFFSSPAETAARPGKKGHAPKKKSHPKPKHHAKHAAKAKAKHAGSKKPRKKTPQHKKNKKAKPKVKHHGKQHVKPQSHKVSRRKHPVDEKHARIHRTHSRITGRLHGWSKHSRHEHVWHHHHWRTHHFAHFHHSGGVFVAGGTSVEAGGVNDGPVEGGSFQFDPGWWNNYVANPGVVGWSDTSPSVTGPALPANRPLPQVVKIDQPLPLSKAGVDLAKVLDGMDVETHWLPYQSVDWKTGISSAPSVKGPASNGGEFVAAACDRFRLSVPHSELEDFMPGNQSDWFLDIGKEKGWIKVGEVESQTLANQGWVVVALWQNMASAGKRNDTGQVAIVYPDTAPVSMLAERGPLVAMAGPQNHKSIGVKDGFPAGAWTKQEVVYLAHRPGK